ncbi:site-specific recombinase XerD [Rhodococcus sp. AG1013]|uniref:site-specific integrase n=1 Tax=Rhodococcus sp. AG1013 TaxID=2183996 RepID=UPI000E0B68BF|nr:site-specific integrase [Rhodococcus sp. AG1013]RDI32394.1 site-specific recombinase XerD [Rhodococcus sp. AG1013]
MASITAYETAKGRRYRVRYRTPQGRQTDKRGFATKKAAEAFAATVEVKKLTGQYVSHSAGRVVFKDLAEDWAAGKVNLKPTSTERNRQSLDNQVLPAWGDVAVGDITRAEIQRWIASMVDKELSPSTIRKAHNVLSAVLMLAVTDNRIASNPAETVSLPRLRKKPQHPLTLDQLMTFAEYAGYGRRAVLVMGLVGPRWGEMAALKAKRWDPDRRRLRLEESVTEIQGKLTWGTPKTHEARSLAVPPFLADELDALTKSLRPEDLLFPARGGGVMRNKNARRDWFDPAVLKLFPPVEEPAAGETPAPSVNFTPHDLRHTAASIAISRGANVKAVQKMLGHATATMTLDHYGHLFDDDLDDVAARIDPFSQPHGTVVNLASRRSGS